MVYTNTKVGSLPKHKFAHYTRGDEEATQLPVTDAHPKRSLRYNVEVYVDDFMSIVMPTSKAQLDHVANAIMRGIHDVFPADIVDSNDPISEKKLKREKLGTAHSKHFWALILMVTEKQCGSRKKRVQNS